MSEVTQAFWHALTGDGYLQSTLGVYPSGTTTAAVFTTEPIPGDADITSPFIVTAGNVSDIPFDWKQTENFGREVLRDVRCYAPETGGALVVENVAEQVRTIFHRRQILVYASTWVLSTVQNIITADEDGFFGRVVSVRVLLDA